ncbi:MAG: ral secretion pathway protein [Sphingomonadales bacterium]|jgi:general secretion pathway protein J|nr:ral secretion pathway protein [Sphingomonadales bacterium]
MTFPRHPGESRDLRSRRLGGSPRGPGFRRDDGFTLVELLVSLFIFGMLSAAGVALLSFSVRAQEAAGARLGDLADFRRAGALLAGDLAQAAPRLARDGSGRAHAAFEGNGGEQGGVALAFVRRGWENLDDTPRASLQRVEYSLADGRLERRIYPRLDGAAPLPATTVVDGVRRVRLRYRDREGAWRERWDPTKATELPRAVELVLDAEGSGTTRQLFQTGTMW